MRRSLRPLAFVLVVVGATTGCAGSLDLGRPFAPSRLEREQGWTGVPGVPLVLQRGPLDCGAAATAMVLRYWRQPATSDGLRLASGLPSERGLPAGWMRDHVRSRGLEAYLIEGTVDDLRHELDARRPVLVGVVRGRVAHYQVVIGYHPERRSVAVVDPVGGWLEIPLETFERSWAPSKRLTLVAFPPPTG